MRDTIFEKLLTKIKYTKDPEIPDGKIIGMKFDADTFALTLQISFPHVLPVKPIFDFNEALKSGIVSGKIAKSVEIVYSYEEETIGPSMVKEYYQFILKALTEKKVVYKCLETFNANYNTNEVKLWVGKGDDKQIVEPLYEMVRKSFERLGLTFVRFSIEINPFLLPIRQTIEISRKEDLKNIVNAEGKEKRQANVPLKGEKKYKRRRSPKINGKVTNIADIPLTESAVTEYNQKNGTTDFVIVGIVSDMKITVTKKGNYRIYQATVTDSTGSIYVKTFINGERNGLDDRFYAEKAGNGCKVRIYGYARYDAYLRDVVIQLQDIISHGKQEVISKTDDAPIKRVELHAHSKMTFLDSVLDIEAYVKRAKEYKHRALALTDKNSVQGLGEFQKATEEAGIMPIYGMEVSFTDESKFRIAFGDYDIKLKDASYVVLDFETTGLSPNYNEIIEIGASRIEHGMITAEFTSFVNPHRLLSPLIVKITGITNDDLRNAPFIEEIMPKFLEFCRGSVLVAHNASFDSGYLYRNLQKLDLYEGDFPFIDTLALARVRYQKKLKKFGLEDLCKLFGVTLTQHHRAGEDAKATAQIFLKMLSDLYRDSVFDYRQINEIVAEEDRFRYIYPSHLILLAKNREGLVNLNRIVTDSNTEHFHNGPKTVRSFLDRHREGLLVGSACFHGDVFDTARSGTYEDLLRVIDYYDYLEVQPVSAYSYVMREEDIKEEDIEEIIRTIIKAGKEKGKITVATGDVHELDPEDRIYRKMIYSKPLIGGGIHEFAHLTKLPETHFRTTREMLDAFSFLPEEEAYEIVVTNTDKIVKMIENFRLFPDRLFAPGDDFMKDFGVFSAAEDVKRITCETAKEIYGDPLPQLIEKRIKRELEAIIDNGFASIYYIAYLLVKRAHDDGYVVGSRGSVGSSVVAAFMKITEVNALPTHYRCPRCKFSAFRYTDEEIRLYRPSSVETELQEILRRADVGPDLPPRRCPRCGEEMIGDGFNIPFEVFLGYDGKKVPDIDLNFPGEYQAKAHAFCREIFGEENTFRGGTVGKIARKTAENYINDFFVKNNKMIRRCEVQLMTPYIEGIKRQTGQHPGGIVVVPKGIDINEITPVQYPADDLKSDWKTTHIDYHKFEANLLKLDILGHDDPRMVGYLMKFVKRNPKEFPFSELEDIPINDPDVLRMFSGVDILKVKEEEVLSETGSTGLPEFGTVLSKNMLTEIKPRSVAELIKISGLSHGIDVWAGNARDYFLGLKGNYGKIPFDELIGCRDDIMNHLIGNGIEAPEAFRIMESVRRGKGLTDDDETLLKGHDIEEWYIDCCRKIKYLFPKAHATAYVIMALRIAWFKLYKPLYYYSGFFSKRVDAFEITTLTGGYEAILTRVKELSRYAYIRTNEEGDAIVEDTPARKGEKLLVGLQVALEMVSRGFCFINAHVNKSDAADFLIEGNGLRIPLKAIDSFGMTTAAQLVRNRGDVPFTSIRDVMNRGRISGTLIDKLYKLDVLEGLPKDDEVGIFRYLSENEK